MANSTSSQTAEKLTVRILNIKEELKTHPWLNTWEPPYSHYVGRAIATTVKFKSSEGQGCEVVVEAEQSPLANPYKVNKESEREEKIEQYKKWLTERDSDPMSDQSVEISDLAESLIAHKTLNLSCWCSPKKCHAEVIASFVVERVQAYYNLQGLTTPVEVGIEYIPARKGTKSRSRLTQLPWSEQEYNELKLECSGCEKCELYSNRINSVWSRGKGGKKIMIVGEAPGEKENELGLPFVGDSGKMLEVMLSSVGLDSQEDCWIVNAVKCRPPENRDPSPKEVDACFNFLQAQIAILRPKIILAVGKISTRRLIGKGDFKITVCRGNKYPLDLTKWKLGDSPQGLELVEYLKTAIVIPTYHPAFLLRNPSTNLGGYKWETWQDLMLLKSLIE